MVDGTISRHHAVTQHAAAVRDVIVAIMAGNDDDDNGEGLMTTMTAAAWRRRTRRRTPRHRDGNDLEGIGRPTQRGGGSGIGRCVDCRSNGRHPCRDDNDKDGNRRRRRTLSSRALTAPCPLLGGIPRDRRLHFRVRLSSGSSQKLRTTYTLAESRLKKATKARGDKLSPN